MNAEEQDASLHNNGLAYFTDENLKQLTGVAISGLRFIPKTIKARLAANDAMNDVYQTIYCATIEYWRKLKQLKRTSEDKLQKRTFDALMKHVNSAIYEVIRDLIPDYKRKKIEFHAPKSFFNQVECDEDGPRPINKKLAEAAEQGERDAVYSRLRVHEKEDKELTEVRLPQTQTQTRTYTALPEKHVPRALVLWVIAKQDEKILLQETETTRKVKKTRKLLKGTAGQLRVQ